MAVPVFVALVIVLAVHKKRPLLLLTGAGTLFSLVLLSFVQGRYSPYRTCQVFALFVALAGLAVYDCCAALRPGGLCCWAACSCWRCCSVCTRPCT